MIKNLMRKKLQWILYRAKLVDLQDEYNKWHV